MTSRYRSFKHRTRLLIDEALTAVKRGFSDDVNQQLRPVEIAQLEQRILMSASPAALVADVPESAAVAESAEAISDTAAAEYVPAPEAIDAGDVIEQSKIQATVELVVIDPSADGHEQLVADLQSQDDRAFEILMLNPRQDGIAQITDALQTLTHVSAIHVVSHGDEGEILLGTSVLSQRNINRYAAELISWQGAMTSDADLLIYGCNLAASDSGVSLTESLSTLTGADVAASDDLTGHQTLQGDWDLEIQQGDVETEIAFSDAVQEDWHYVLVTATVNQTLDVVNGDTSSISSLLADDGGDGISLREAIIAANGNPGESTVVIEAGTYVLTRGGHDDSSAFGDLDVSEDVIITGAGAGNTIIDASGLTGGDADRVFHLLNNAEVTIEGVTIRGGNAGSGAGIYIDGAATLALSKSTITGNDSNGQDGGGFHNESAVVTLTDVTISDNTAAGMAGGGIYNAGQLTLNRVTVSDNTAQNGGGIFSHGSGAEVTLTNVTISGNSATGNGGGLITDEVATIVSSTIAYNTGANGGGINASGGGVTIQSSILANNTLTDGLTASNLLGTVTSLGYNIDGDGAAGFSSTGDLTGDPLLNSTLTVTDGGTATHALLPGSIAIDASHQAFAASQDQRGFSRSSTPDIGAFESNPVRFYEAAEFAVNEGVGSDQETSASNRGSQRAVAVLPGGNYVVTWSSNSQDGSGWGTYARIFNATGTAVTGELLVNQTTADNQRWARVAADASGNFIVTWTSTNQDGTTESVYARRFNSSGVALANEFRVNSTNTGSQANSTVAANDAGDFIIVWQGEGPGDATGIHAQRYDSSGATVGGEFTVNTPTAGTQRDASVDINASGEFAITWDDGTTVYAQSFNANAVAQGDVVVGNSGSDNNADLAINVAGEFVVVWHKTNGIFGDGVYQRAFNLDASELRAEEVVNTQVFGNQKNSSITMDASGQYVVSWEGQRTDDSEGVQVQRFSSDGSKIGDETAVNTTTSGAQQYASVAGFNVDSFVVVWSGEGAASSMGVFARQFGPAAPVNVSPVVDAGQMFSVPEAAANNATVGTVTATDGNSGDVLTGWAIASGNADGIFAINSGTGEITVVDNTNLDFSATNSYTLGITVSDGTLTSAVADVVISVTETNVAPIAGNDSYMLSEGGTLSENVVSGWFNESWKQRQRIAFDNSSQAGNLLNHAVLVTLHASDTDAVVIDYSRTQDQGQDLRFIDGDGTPLNHEIESWDESGYSYVWVEVPQIDGGVSTDFVWMYYDHSTVAARQQETATWENDDVVVLHMNGNALDSSAAGNDGSVFNVAISNGIIGGAGSFNGATSGIVVGSDASVDDVFDGGGTISAWINADSLGQTGHGRIADKASTTLGTNGDGWDFQLTGVGASGRLQFDHGFTGSIGRWQTAAGTINLNTWHHVAVVFDSSNASSDPQFYVDGVLQSTTEVVTPTGTARSDADEDLVVGNHNGGGRTFDGLIDEFRMSNQPGSADEFAAMYSAGTAGFVSSTAHANGPGGVLNNDVDVNADSLTVTLVAGPANADSFTLNADGSFEYVHDGSETTTDSFTYQTSDGTLSSTATVSLTVIAINDAPTISAIANQSISEDTSTGTIGFTIGDAETPANGLIVSAVSSNQTLIPDANISLGGSGTNRTINVTPAANATGGPATITVTISDGTSSSTTSFLVTVTPVNDIPIISAITDMSVAEDTADGPIAFTVGDVETAAAGLVVTATSDNQTLIPDAAITLGGSGTNRSISFTPALHASGGPATITVVVSDGTASSSTSFQVTVSAINDSPTVSTIADQVTAEDVLIDSLAFTIGDVETALNSLTVSATSSNQSVIPDANITLGGSGVNRTISIQPGADAAGGPVTITLTVSDGTTSTDTTFDVTVIAVNDAPTISSVADVNTTEDTTVGPIAFTIADSESAAADLIVTATSDNQTLVPNSAIVLGGSGTNRTISFTPAANASGGPATITISVSDGSIFGSRSFDVNVSPVNDAPTVSAIANVTTPEDVAVGPMAFTIGDTENTASTLSITATSNDQTVIADSAITLGGSGSNRTISFTPTTNASGGPVTITVTVSDGTTSTNTTFDVDVTPVNDAPTISGIADVTTAENTAVGPLNFTVGDVETSNASLIVSASSSDQTLIADSAITVGGSGTNRTLSFTPVLNVNGGPAVITVTVSDGTLSTTTTFDVTVLAVNSAPTISSIADIAIAEDTSTGPIAFTIEDVESAAATLSISASSSDQSLIADADITLGGSGTNRTLRFTPVSNAYGGPATISVTVSDGTASTTTTFDVVVTAVNDGPTISAIPDGNSNEDVVVGPISFSISDIDTAASSVLATATSSDQAVFSDDDILISGTGATRTITLSPAANVSGVSATITLTVSDGLLSSSTSFVQTVMPVNDTPQVSPVADHVILEDTASGPISFTISDVETAASALSVAVNSADQGLVADSAIVVSGTGASRTISFTPGANASGTTTLTIQVSDGLSTGVHEFDVTVSPVNDVPTISTTADVVMAEDTQAGPIVFTIGDIDASATDLTVTATSNNQAVIKDLSLEFSGGGVDRRLILTPEANAFGTATITVTVSDGGLNTTSEFDVLVTPVNDAPRHLSHVDTTHDVPGDDTLSVSTHAGLLTHVTDVENDVLTVVVTQSPKHGMLTVAANGSFTFEPSTTYSGIDSFQYRVTDGSDYSAAKTVNLVTPIAVVTSVPQAVFVSETTESSSDTTQETNRSEPETHPEDEAHSESAHTHTHAHEVTSSGEDEEEHGIVAPVNNQDDDESREFLTTVNVETGESSFMFSQAGAVQTVDGIRVNASGLKSFDAIGSRGRIEDTATDALRLAQISHDAFAFEQYAELKGTAEQIEQFRRNIASDYEFTDVAASVVTVGGTSIVIGSVVTALRTGVLALGLLSQLPVWTLFDPLMVMDGVSGSGPEDEDSLQDLVDKAAGEQKERPN